MVFVFRLDFSARELSGAHTLRPGLIGLFIVNLLLTSQLPKGSVSGLRMVIDASFSVPCANIVPIIPVSFHHPF